MVTDDESFFAICWIENCGDVIGSSLSGTYKRYIVLGASIVEIIIDQDESTSTHHPTDDDPQHSRARDLPTHSSIKNNLGDGKKMSLHCQSVEDDLGMVEIQFDAYSFVRDEYMCPQVCWDLISDDGIYNQNDGKRS